MRTGYEFRFHCLPVASGDTVADATLDLLGAQGWRMVGITTSDAGIICALERQLDREAALPDGDTLAAALVEPLSAPPSDILAERPREAYETEG